MRVTAKKVKPVAPVSEGPNRFDRLRADILAAGKHRFSNDELV